MRSKVWRAGSAYTRVVHCAPRHAVCSAVLQPRRALSDITNTQPLYLTPPRRSTSALPGQLLGEGERHKHSPLSSIERAAIVVLTADRQPAALVASKLCTSKQIVRLWNKRFRETGDVEDAQRSGRPKLIKQGGRQAIAHYTAADPHHSTPKQLRLLLDFDCAPRTIRRELDDLGMLGRVARYSPPLNEVHRLKRMSFCNGYGCWTLAQWTTVLWSDEASVEMGPHGQRWVQRPRNEEWNPLYTLHKTKHPPKCHIWGCMSAAGVGCCYVFTDYLDKELMVVILRDHLLQSAKLFWPEGSWWFQQDNDPKHTSKVVQAWMHNNGVSCLEWPPYSPDLNPIEQVWTDVKRRVEEAKPKNLEELKEELQAQWYATDAELCQKLVESMPRRMEAARKHGGWMSGY